MSTEESLEFIQPEEVINIDQVFNGDVGEAGLHESREIITEPDIVMDEDDAELATTEIL